MTPGSDMVRRFRIEFGVLALLLSMASVARAAGHGAIISGVVRDSKGVPQMGAVVQILSADAAVKATAYTDLLGRYSVVSLLPGSYGVRASAALFLPALRSNLRLQPGHRSIVNLTLSALFDESSWLPARPRGKDETSDDWNWTLRSSAARPILKVADDDDGLAQPVEAGRPRSVTRVRVRLTSPSNRFAHGVATADVRAARLRSDGAGFAIEASISPDTSARGIANAGSDASMSYERPMGPAGVIGGRVHYESHPEITVGGGAAGFSVMSISSAERFGVGDFGEIEAGSRVQAVTGPVSRTVTRPFVRVAVHPGVGWLVTYHFATAPDLQDYEAATASDGDVPVCGYVGGRLQVANGLHQEITLAHKSRGTVVAVAYYDDALDQVALSGGVMGGISSAGSLPSNGVLRQGSAMVDGSNGTFEALGRGYGASGVNLVLTHELEGGALMALQYSAGTALARAANVAGDGVAVPPVQARRGQAAAVSVRAGVKRTGTKVRVSYRWQPGVLVTAIDPYDVAAGGEYLSIHVQQPIVLPGLIREGMELTLDGGNLLRQGYRQFQGEQSIPLYLAASPTSFQAGLAFSF